jgi:hypothetical protein
MPIEGGVIMGIILDRGNENTFHLKHIGWCYMLNLGEIYGWKPEGTKKPKGFGVFKKWPGNYDSSDGQKVTATDSNSLASALIKAMDDPEFDAKSKLLISKIVKAIEKSIGHELGYSIEVDREIISELIGYLKQGGFMIN